MHKFILAFLLLVLSISFAASESFDVSFNPADFSLVNSGKSYLGKEVKAIKTDQNLSTAEKIGEPALPVVTINYYVPNGTELNDFDFTFSSESFAENVLLEPVQPHTPTMENIALPEWVKPVSETYKSNKSYPENIVEFVGEQQLNNYRMLSFNITPFRYNPVKGNIEVITDMDIRIDYDQKRSNLSRNDNGLLLETVREMVINPDDVIPAASRANRADNVEYLIITNNSCKSAFQPLADWKTQTGLRAEVVTVESIKSNYTGNRTQVKIKKCIEDYFDNKGTMWVLLGGDDSVVPDQNTYGIVNNNPQYSDKSMPADLFYVAFDNNYEWNANGNSTYGETSDNVDLNAELFASRAPIRNANQATVFVNKTLNYIKNPPRNNFANKIYYTGEKLWNYGDAYGKTKNMHDNYIKPYWKPSGDKTYDWLLQSHSSNSMGLSGCTTSNMTKMFNAGYGLMHMATHGNQTIWATESGYFSSNSATALSNQNKQGIIVTIACITNAFDQDGTSVQGSFNQDPCLSEAFIRNPNGGGVGYIGSSRYGWGNGGSSTQHGVSFVINREFFKRLFSGANVGNGVPAARYKLASVAFSARATINSYAAYDGAHRWLVYTVNPIGDPELDILTDDPTDFDISGIPSVLQVGANNLDLSTGIANARVCLTNSDDVYVSGVADNSGDISLSVNTTTVEKVTLTVTGHNKVPYIQELDVISGGKMPPKNLVAKGANKRAILTWEKPDERAISQYNIYRDEVKINSTTELTYTDEGLTNGQEYAYRVTATYTGSTSGESPPTAKVKVTPNPMIAFCSDPEELNADVQPESTSDKTFSIVNTGEAAFNYTTKVTYVRGREVLPSNAEAPEIKEGPSSATDKSDPVTEDRAKEYIGFYNNNGNNSYGFGGGKVYCAIRLTSTELSAHYDDKDIHGIQIDLASGYSNLKIHIYEGDNASKPSTELHSQSVDAPGDIIFEETIPMEDGKDYWFAYSFDHTSEAYPANADNGPSVAGKGDLYSQDGQSWAKLSDADAKYHKNWKIKAILDEKAETWLEVINGAAGNVALDGRSNVSLRFNSTGFPLNTVKQANVVVTSTNGESCIMPVAMTVTTVGINDEENLNSLALMNNYPNPFNPVTTIKYNLIKDTKISLAVYNTKGELVQTLVNGKKASGTYSVKFDGKNLNSGVYYYKLTTPEKTLTNKMVLIK